MNGVASIAKKMILHCYHCGNETPPCNSYVVELHGQTRQFCCAGCLAISQTIYLEGLDIFYSRRIGTGDKPDEYFISDEIPQKLLPYDDLSLRDRFTRLAGKNGELETTLRLEKIRCAACVWLCQQHLLHILGVRDVQMNYVTQKAMVVFHPDQTSLARILFEIEKIGYEAWPFEPSELQERSKREKRQLLTRLGVALLGMMQVMMYAWPSYTDPIIMGHEYRLLMNWSGWLLTVPVMIYSAGPIFQSAWKNVYLLRRSHILGMDVPIALALGLSFAAGTINLITGVGESFFDSITMFVAFILAARYIELSVRQDAQGGAEALVKQLPAICERVPHYPDVEKIELAPVVNCAPGNILRVSPGEIIPVDGVLLQSESEVDESMLSGESKPVEKNIGDHVFAGSYNMVNPIFIRVDAIGQSTRIAGIASLLDHALLIKPQMVTVSEKWAHYFVILLMASAFISSAIWLSIDPSKAWVVFVSVLVASCPCALSLAVPTAMAAAQGAVTKLGLLVVKPHVMEGLVKVTDLVLDKTGTITTGRPELQDIINLRPGYSRAQALALAAAMEVGQKHPLAISLLRAAQMEDIQLPHLTHIVSNQLGKGLHCGIYSLGSAQWLGLQQDRQTGQFGQVHLADDQGLIASFVFSDTPRNGLENFLQKVQQRNIRVHLISGDDPITVAWWANHWGIEIYLGACSPEGKLLYIHNLQEQGRVVWAIGDGVNDAPLLAKANISTAIGDGAPLATAGADTILTAQSLQVLAITLNIADKTRKIIQQNFIWAFTYNVIAIPIAMMGWVNPWLAGIGMSISSLVVTLNAWRLRKA